MTADTEKAYEFYGFISYKRGEKDEEWARWLHRKIESYRVPVADLRPGTSPEEGNIPKRLKVFLDKTDLGSKSDLEIGLSDSLDVSKYLIVICSNRSASSIYVDAEVSRFVETGRADHIIPFVIDSQDSGEDIRYPPSLPADTPAIFSEGLNEETLLNLLSRMLGVDYRAMYEVHMRVTRRKYTRLLSLAASVVFLIFGLVMLALSADRKAQIQTIEAEGLANFIYFDILEKSAGYVPVSRSKIISEKLFEYYRRWQDEDATSVYPRAKVLQEIGSHAADMGEVADVVIGYSQSALDLAEKLYATDPTNRAYFDFYYDVLWKAAKMCDLFPNEEWLEKGAQYCRRAIEICASFRDCYPESPDLWESNVAHSFKAYAENRLEVQEYRKKQELSKVMEYQRAKEYDKAKETLDAIMAVNMEEYAEAEDILQKARQAYETMESRRPERFLAADMRQILKELYHDYAHLYNSTDRDEQAVVWMRRSVEMVRQLHQEDKRHQGTWMSLGNEIAALMEVEWMAGDYDSAEIHFEEALQIREQMVERHPDNNILWLSLATTMLQGSNLKYVRKDLEAAIALAAGAYEITSKLVRLHPESEFYAMDHKRAAERLEMYKRDLKKR